MNLEVWVAQTEKNPEWMIWETQPKRRRRKFRYGNFDPMFDCSYSRGGMDWDEFHQDYFGLGEGPW